MSTKNLTGTLLILGPILILGAFIGWPVGEDTAEGELIALVKDPSFSKAIMVLFLTGIILLFTGLSMSSRTLSMSARSTEGSTKWSALATPSGILFPLCIAVMAASVGLNFGALGIHPNSVESANAIYLVGYHLTEGVGLIMGIAFALFGISLADRYADLLHRVIGSLYVIIGIGHLLGIFTTGNDVLGIVTWMGMFFVSGALGVITLRDKD